MELWFFINLLVNLLFWLPSVSSVLLVLTNITFIKYYSFLNGFKRSQLLLRMKHTEVPRQFTANGQDIKHLKQKLPQIKIACTKLIRLGIFFILKCSIICNLGSMIIQAVLVSYFCIQLLKRTRAKNNDWTSDNVWANCSLFEHFIDTDTAWRLIYVSPKKSDDVQSILNVSNIWRLFEN